MREKIFIACISVFISCHIFSQEWKKYEDSAMAYWKQRKPDSAIKYYRHSIDLYTKNIATLDSNHIRQSGNLASMYKSLSRFDNAEKIHIDLLDSIRLKKSKTHPTYIQVSNELVSTYLITGKYDPAEILLLDCLSILTALSGDNRMTTARLYNSLAVLYRHAGKYDKAEHYYLETMYLLEKIGGQDMAYAHTINNLGVLYTFIAKYKEAEKCILQGKEMKARLYGKDHEEYAIAGSTLGILYMETGRLKEAESLFAEARNIIEAKFTKNHFDYATFTFNLGRINLRMGQYDKAEERLLEAKEIQDRIYRKIHPEIGRTLSDLGVLYSELGQYEKAVASFTAAKEVIGKTLGETHPEYFVEYNSLAGSYAAAGNYAMAEACAKDVKNNIEKFPEKNKLLYISNNILRYNILIYKKEYDLAKNLALSTLDSTEKYLTKQSRFYVIISENLGLINSLLNQSEKAAYYYKQANEIANTLFGTNHLITIRTTNSLANFAWTNKDYQNADSLFAISWQAFKLQLNQQFSFQNEVEKQSFIKLYDATAYMTYSLYYENPSTNKNAGQLMNVALQSKLVLLNSLKNLRDDIYLSGNDQLKDLYATWISLREQYSFWVSKPLDERKGLEFGIKEQADSIEKELIKLSSNFTKKQILQTTNWEDIQQSLHAGEAAIQFIDFKYYDSKRWTDSTYYIAVIVRKDRAAPEVIKMFEAAELEKILKLTKSTSKEATLNLRYGKSKLLFELIWKPLEKNLVGIKKVYFTPSGVLHKIPIGALAINTTERVSDKYKMFQLNTLATIDNLSPDSIFSTDKYSLYGGILYDGDTTALRNAAIKFKLKDVASRSIGEDSLRGKIWQYLADSKKEVESIHKIAVENKMTGQLFMEMDATEESVKSLQPENSPAILHLATHGYFYPNPSIKPDRSVATEGRTFRQSENPLFRSGLTLAGANYAWSNNPIKGIQDGILTAYEVSNLYWPHTKLVVLSACETGLGDIQGSEGVYGLQRAFKIAGAKNLVMSLWDVPDAETAEFMTEFYRKLFTGNTIDDAFRNTQATMRNKYRNEPYKWAAWILVR